MLKRVFPFLKNRVLGNKKYTRFIILTRGRSGSEWLVSILNSHPDCLARGELFKHCSGIAARSLYHKQFHRKWARNIQAVGIKIFYHHPLNSKDNTIWDLLMEDPGVKVVHLLRKNQLRTFVSAKLGELNRQWTMTDENDRKKKSIVVDLNELFAYFDHACHPEKIERLQRLRTRHQIYTLYYEDLVRDYSNEVTRLLSFLGLKYRDLDSYLKKQNPYKVEDIVENYQEISEALAGTEYAFMLDKAIDI